MAKRDDNLMEAIFNEAYLAAVNAVNSGDKEDVGACGFAWVNVHPANGPFVGWCKKKIKEIGFKVDGAGNFVAIVQFPTRDAQWTAQSKARIYGGRGTYGGWQFWNPGQYNGQRIDVKERGSYAFAEVLRKYEINAFSASRLD